MDEKNKIYPPSMDILYAKRDPSYVYPGMETCTFEVAYTMDNEKFWATWDILLILAMSASAFSWIYRMMQFTRRRQNQDFDASFIIHAVAMAAGDLCTAITAILICCSGYWFLFFKAQADVYTMVPVSQGTLQIYIGYIKYVFQKLNLSYFLPLYPSCCWTMINKCNYSDCC